MDFAVFTIDDKIAGQVRHQGAVSSEDLDGLAVYVLKNFAAGSQSMVDAVVFADGDGNLTFIEPRSGEVERGNRYAMTADHLYSTPHNPSVGTWDACRRLLDGHDVVLATFHSQENAVACAEKDARGGSERGLT